MRIIPITLIAIGIYGLLQHYGLIDAEAMKLFWPVLLITLGVALLLRGPRWRADRLDRLHDRWEERMHRRFGPGWAAMTEEERERFRAGMRQWRSGAVYDVPPAGPTAASSPAPSDPSASREPR